MKLQFNRKRIYSLLLGVVSLAAYTGCQPETFGDGNGIVAPDASIASFTVTPVADNANKFVLKAGLKDVLGVKWDRGEGGGSAFGTATDTAFYPDAGTYTITLTAIGKGGVTRQTSKEVTVATSDPVAGNLVQGGKMRPEDDSKWTRVTYSPGVTFAIEEGKMVARGGSGGHAGIYQAIDVVAGKKYKVDMNVSGSGATDVWFEVYVGTAEPGAGDYNSGGTRLALNTWNGCGKSTFSGKLSAISCAGTGGGIVSFTQTGKVYLMIRGGGANFGTSGIAITNVELRGTK